jgi:hypothetical protein
MLFILVFNLLFLFFLYIFCNTLPCVKEGEREKNVKKHGSICYNELLYEVQKKNIIIRFGIAQTLLYLFSAERVNGS